LSKGWIPNKKPASIEKHTSSSPEIMEACEEWVGFLMEWSTLVYHDARKPGDYSFILRKNRQKFQAEKLRMHISVLVIC
jgi:hypothetical protein